ncbi:hypothetical protein A3649_19615 [Mycobacterium ulcerans]|nr:hypothetical protein A3649_19615 [Mycobacterium ulcerans]
MVIMRPFRPRHTGADQAAYTLTATVPKTDLEELYGACHAARAHSDLTGMVAMFTKILDAEPAYDF